MKPTTKGIINVSETEEDALRLTFSGCSIERAARIMGCPTSTVVTCLRNVGDKLGYGRSLQPNLLTASYLLSLVPTDEESTLH